MGALRKARPLMPGMLQNVQGRAQPSEILR